MRIIKGNFVYFSFSVSRRQEWGFSSSWVKEGRGKQSSGAEMPAGKQDPPAAPVTSWGHVPSLWTQLFVGLTWEMGATVAWGHLGRGSGWGRWFLGGTFPLRPLCWQRLSIPHHNYLVSQAKKGAEQGEHPGALLCPRPFQREHRVKLSETVPARTSPSMGSPESGDHSPGE